MAELLTMAEVAKILHCSRGHVCHAVNGGITGCTPIPVIRIGRRLLVRRESLEQWMQENETGNARMALLPDRGAGKRA